MVDNETFETKLHNALAPNVTGLALEINERETNLAALEDPPEGLAELGGVLLHEHTGRVREGF